MGCDVVVTGASVSDDYRIVPDEKGQWLNEYRMKMRQGDIYVEVVDYPLAHAQTKADIDNLSFPDPDAPAGIVMRRPWSKSTMMITWYSVTLR